MLYYYVGSGGVGGVVVLCCGVCVFMCRKSIVCISGIRIRVSTTSYTTDLFYV